MRTPVIAGNNVTWRAIGGVDFQVIAPYVMVAKPDRRRAVWVWLRKTGGQWSVYVTPAGGKARTPIGAGRSAVAMVRLAMREEIWSSRVEFTPTRLMPVPEWSYPEPVRRYQRTPGSYYDRPTAHDGRWDTSRSGGHVRS